MKKKQMLAVVLDEFGDYNKFDIRQMPIPDIDDDEVLIEVNYAGIGQWDTFEREGGYDRMLGMKSRFPYILGSEGSGMIASKGKNVKNLEINDLVSAVGFLNQKGGFYAEYVSVNNKYVKKLPNTITSLQASVISGVGLTALRGLTDILQMKKGENIAVFGASGGVGHIAVQIAKSLGTNIYAIASESDGVSLVKDYEIEHTVNGKKEDIIAKAHAFGFHYFDKILLTCSHEFTNNFIEEFCRGGIVAYPNGIFPEPETNKNVDIVSYNGEPDEDILTRLFYYIESGKIRSHVDRVFYLKQVADAHKHLTNHYVGKLAFKVSNQEN